MRKLRITRVSNDRRPQPVGSAICGKLWQEARQPARVISGCENAPHHVGFCKTRRKEVLAGLVVSHWAVFVVEEELPRAISSKRRELAIIRSAGCVNDKTESKRRLAVLAGAYGVRELRQPGF